MLCDLGGLSICSMTRKRKAQELLQLLILVAQSTLGLHLAVSAYDKLLRFHVFLRLQGSSNRALLSLAVFRLFLPLYSCLRSELEPFCYSASFLSLLTVKRDTVPPCVWSEKVPSSKIALQ